MPEQTTETNESDRCKYIHSAVWREDLKLFNVCSWMSRTSARTRKNGRVNNHTAPKHSNGLNKQPKQMNRTDASTSILMFGDMVLNNLKKKNFVLAMEKF